MVATLHDAGIAVLLDVVYNHTAEGSQLGPTLAFRGLDNAAYYHLADDRAVHLRRHRHRQHAQRRPPAHAAADHRQPAVLGDRDARRRLPVRPRAGAGPRSSASTTSCRRSSTCCCRTRCSPGCTSSPSRGTSGAGGYEVGNFPVNWSEWNGRYRDTVRRFWAGAPQQLGDLATRLSGSADLYGDDGRRPSASINFVTVHDGFTLADLVSYERKHNEANLQDNTDGTDQNDSWNCGAEGPTDDPAITALRRRQVRNLLLTLRAQPGRADAAGRRRVRPHPAGNNNAYCQDGELTWLDWELDDERHGPAGVHPAAAAAARGRAGVPPARLLPGPPDHRRRRQGHLLGEPGGPGDAAGGLVHAAGMPRGAAGRRGDRRARRRRRPDRRQQLPAAAQRRRRRRSSS